jgi:hypothetical protein
MTLQLTSAAGISFDAGRSTTPLLAVSSMSVA